MEAFTIDAVVLKEVKYKEADGIITLFTRKKGIITAMAKGLYRQNSKNRPAIQLFCLGEYEITSSKAGYLIKTATLKEQFFKLRQMPEYYALACYFAETVMALCTSENDETDAFRLVLNTFAVLNAPILPKQLWQIKSAFELKLCSVCGFMPELEMCSICSAPEEETLENSPEKGFAYNGKYVFSLSESSLVCNACYTSAVTRHDSSVFVSLSRASLYAARYITASPIERFLSFRITDTDAAEFADFTEKYMLFVAERGFSTLKYFKTLEAQSNN